MPPVRPTININQFNQTPAPGDLDLQITASRVITGVISANLGVSFLNAGDAVILDPAITVQGQPQFRDVADNADCLGFVKRTAKASKFFIGDQVEVTFFGGPVIWEIAATTIAPGQTLEMSGGFFQPKAAGALRGIALDPAVISQLFRVISLSGLV